MFAFCQAELFFGLQILAPHVPPLLILTDASARNGVVTTLHNQRLAVGVEDLEMFIVKTVAFKCQHF